MNEERKNKVIFVKVPGKYQFVRDFLRHLADRLLAFGLLKKVYPDKLIIETDHVYCRLFPSAWDSGEKLLGRHCDECFGFSEETTAYLRWDHNPENAYKGSVLDYICEVEGVEYDGDLTYSTNHTSISTDTYIDRKFKLNILQEEIV